MTAEQKMLNPTDRILILQQMEGKKAKDSYGMTDPKLFTGENKMHVLKEPQTNFWYFKYEQGSVPEVMKCKFTTFTAALKFAAAYYMRRNIEIKEVIA